VIICKADLADQFSNYLYYNLHSNMDFKLRLRVPVGWTGQPSLE